MLPLVNFLIESGLQESWLASVYKRYQSCYRLTPGNTDC